MTSVQASNKENIQLYTPARKGDVHSHLTQVPHDAFATQQKAAFGQSNVVVPPSTARKALGDMSERIGQRTPAVKTQHLGTQNRPNNMPSQFKQPMSTVKGTTIYREELKEYPPILYMPLPTEETFKPEIDIDLDALLAPRTATHCNNKIDNPVFDFDVSVKMDSFDLEDDFDFLE